MKKWKNMIYCRNICILKSIEKDEVRFSKISEKNIKKFEFY